MTERLEREIEEILDKIEQFPSPESRWARAQKQAIRRFGGVFAERQRAFASQLGRISMSQVMLASFLLILGALFFRRLGPANQWLLYAGIILFITSFAVLMFTRRSSPAGAMPHERWRGRPVRSAQPGTNLVERVRMWWQQRRIHR